MQAEQKMADTATLKLPVELLADLKRHSAKQPTDFRVEGWKPSLLERILGMLGLKVALK
ncbi:MAG: hypothetical protein ACRETH_14275 [Steroidobacteraceae bacterium]